MTALSLPAGWLDGGLMLDGVLGCVLLELAALLAWRALRGRHAVAIDVYWNLASALALLCAAHLQRTGAPWLAVAAALLGALGAHLLALGTRLRGAARTRSVPVISQGG